MKLTPSQRRLVEKAGRAREKAFVPYSHFQVGAALETAKGRVYTGANVESASYGLTLCAERVAIFKAVSEGQREFQAIAVVTRDGATPCGSCRQVLAEFSPSALVLIANQAGEVVREDTVADLLPDAFGPKNLSPTL